ncbi:MAG TPA: metallopeptidase family protein [Thermoleophilia bacterium]|nr:metallopeptidase family protein [Thermoleophilia bacterium]HUK78468.1 metallopeptidase family protein [Thermoleophilia bacterium]
MFARNIEAVSADEADLREQIRVTVLHETAHYFGFDEDGLRRLGLD